MLRLTLPENQPLSLLCLGAHADDIEIGSGATILRLIAQLPRVAVRWVVFSGEDKREAEARDSAAAFLAGSEKSEVEIHKFRDGFFPSEYLHIKERFEALKHAVQPSLILTHWLHDAHQDHRVVAELTRNTFRDHLILEYEIPKYDGDLGNPNLFVTLSRAQLQSKISIILSKYASQASRGWFTEETFQAMARLRGIACNAPEGVAEGFYASKLVAF